MKTDAQLQTDVLHELAWDPQVTHERIGVAVANGIVTLSGKVPTYIEKSAAEKAAQRVAGVKAVVEKIEVNVMGTFYRDDEKIADEIVTQFGWNVQIPEKEIKVRVENGWVELSGAVDWDFQRRAAEKVVRVLAGVSGVSNKISIKEKLVQPETVKRRIEEALKREAEREARRIKVEVTGSEVTLSGNVRNFAEMQDARGAAFSAPGVTRVINNLHLQ